MNYVKLIFGQEFQWPKILPFLANKSCIKCIDSAMFVVNTKEINKIKNEVFEAYFCYSGLLTEKFAIILS